MTTLAEHLGSAQVVVCCGSGGVGKTTVAAALGLQAARLGRRAVVATIDPAKRLADALGVPGGLGNEPAQLKIDGPGELWALMLDTASTFDGLVRANAATAEQAERILANGFYRNVAGSLSGTQEYMAAERLHALHDDKRFDLVIIDTPPTRNALDFLDAPNTLTKFIDHPLFKILMLPGWRIMLMTLRGRTCPELPAEVLFSDIEIEVLTAYAKKKRLAAPKTLGAAVRLVARLGGYIGRRRDPPPGHEVIWRGQAQLSTLCDGFVLGKNSRDPINCG